MNYARLIIPSLFALHCFAQNPPAPTVIPETPPKRVSEHVWAILANPNIAIIVGNRATLVVDTGMGPRNGATIARHVERLSKSRMLYLTTTHFHPEHASGEPGFPAATILVRPAVQQREMESRGVEFLDMFRQRSPLNKELLENVRLRKPDILFDRDLQLDLGGITARLMWFGAGHTKGDELIFVEEESVLVSGDIVENKLIPSLPNADASFKGWLAILEKLEPLKARFVVPDHGELGDGSLLESQRSFMRDLQTRATALKREGKTADDAGRLLTDEVRTKYPTWQNLNGIANAVRRIYAEAE